MMPRHILLTVAIFSCACALAASRVASFSAPTTQPWTTLHPRCEGFTCPNDDGDGGLYAYGECSGEFCECSYGIPYLIVCDEGLVFNEPEQICDWPFNVEGCDEA